MSIPFVVLCLSGLCLFLLYRLWRKPARQRKQNDLIEKLTQKNIRLTDTIKRYEKRMLIAGIKGVDETQLNLFLRKEKIGPFVQLKLHDMDMNMGEFSVAKTVLVRSGDRYKLEDFRADQEVYGKILLQELTLLKEQLGAIELTPGISNETYQAFLSVGGKVILSGNVEQWQPFDLIKKQQS